MSVFTGRFLVTNLVSTQFNFWTLLRMNLNDDSSTNESIKCLSSFHNSVRTEERPLLPTVRVLVCFIRWHWNVLTELLSGNGLFRVHSLLCKRVLIPWQPCISEPLPSNELLFWLHCSGFQPSCHIIKIDLRETGWGGMDRTDLVLVNTVMNLRDP
jgi:hypothetical protein